MAEAATLTAVAIAVGKKILTKPLDDLYESAKGAVKSTVANWRAESQCELIVNRLEQVEFVRTVFSQTPIRISAFYYPCKITDGRHARPSKFAHILDDIGVNKNILILGTVGQGKSILMRYLFVNELRRKEKIPIFLELRGIDKKTTLQQLLIDQFTTYGFDGISKDVLHFLLEKGAFVFFLDGFDEVKREFALPIQQELTGLINRFPNTRWALSSRPGSLAGYAASVPNLALVEIAQLEETDFDPFLRKLGLLDGHREKLLKAIAASSTEIRGVLKTPLMLTLLNLTFGTSTHVPDTLHEFYESMFNFLLTRHDETKLGYVREKATQLSTSDLQDVFEHFCFLSKDYGLALSDDEFSRCAKDASKLSGKAFTPEGFKTDLTETVCLMMRDGIKTAFIHRSIQEFFAAFFLKHLGTESAVKEIYRSLGKKRGNAWAQEMKFLEQIDRYRYLEHCRLPIIEEFLRACGYVDSRSVGVSQTSFNRFLDAIDSYVVTVGTGKRTPIVVVNTSSTVFSVVLMEYFRSASDMVGFLGRDEINKISRDDSVRIADLRKYFKDSPDAYKHYLSTIRSFAPRLRRDQVKLEKLLTERERSMTELLLKKVG